MATYPFNNRIFPRGFSLLEVLVALTVLSVGLVAGAAVMTQMMKGTSRNEYLGLAAMLASEKLEDLNRWPVSDPNVAVTNGATAGSLAADTRASVTVGAVTETVDYYDQVVLSASSGSVAESVSGLNGSGQVQYTTTTHQPDGTVTTVTAATPGNAGGTVTFKRRWLIEKDQPVGGVKRVTVIVMMVNSPVIPVPSFQMTMVRP
jgi:prepilin-type N-terminal cleavage/methylation domain-containing protein